MPQFKPVGLITTDLHLSENEEDAYRFSLFPWILEKYGKNLEAIFILGDLTDRKNFHADVLVNRIVSCVRSLARNHECFILKGNHDFDQDEQCPFFGFLNRFKNVTYIAQPTLVKWRSKRLLFLPHTRHPGEGWNLQERNNLDAIFLHQTFKGAVAENGFPLGGISPTRFRRFECPIFSGDVHVPQQVGPITYVGAPYHVHYGDRFNPRILLADDEFRTTVTQFPAPRKWMLELTSTEELLQYKDRIHEGDRAKVRFYLPRSKFGTWSRHRDELRSLAEKLGLHLQSLILKELVVETRSTTSKQRAISHHRNRKETFAAYCNKYAIDDTLREAGKVFLEP